MKKGERGRGKRKAMVDEGQRRGDAEKKGRVADDDNECWEERERRRKGEKHDFEKGRMSEG